MTDIKLDKLRIASPCRASWQGMKGDDKRRFCTGCKKHVYNLTAMTKRDALALLERESGGVCARVYQRRDGTVILGNCPKGAKWVRRKFVRYIGWLSAIAFAVFYSTIAFGWALSGGRKAALNRLEPIKTMSRRLKKITASKPVPPPAADFSHLIALGYIDVEE